MKRLTTMRTLQCPCCEADILVDVTHYVAETWKDKELGAKPFITVCVVPMQEDLIKEKPNG